jgi:1,2-diacylglycerol 3-alpha-glucosyltransferase
MKIAIFTDFYDPQVNGIVTSTHTLIRELNNRGHEVYVMAPRTKEINFSTRKIWRFRSIPFLFQKEYRLICPISRKLLEFKNLNIDIIHIQTPFFLGYLAQFLSWKNQIPTIHTYHTYWAEYSHYVPFLPQWLARTIDKLLFTKNFCNRCQHIISPSPQMENKLFENGVTTKSTIIPTGINLQKIKKPENVRAFQKKYNIIENNRVLIFVGRCAIEKNLYFLLDCFVKVIKEDQNVVLFIAGDGPEKKYLIKYSKKLGISNKVIFSGYLPHREINTAYAAADIVTFPSKTETQGLSLLEGLAMGKPAVAINAMGVASILKDNNGGFLTSENTNEYSARILELLHTPKLYFQKKVEAISRAKQFSSQNMIDKTLEVYYKTIKYKK